MSTTFHLFPRLPAEIRLQIWEMTVEHRIVEICMPWRRASSGNVIHPLISSTPIPASLHTCRESRNARLYERFYPRPKFVRSDPEEVLQRYVWVNYDVDMIYFAQHMEFGWITHNGPSFKRLMIEGDNNEWWITMGGYASLQIFTNLTEMHVILSEDSEFEHWYGASDYFWPCAHDKVLFINPRTGGKMTLSELESHFDRMSPRPERNQGYIMDSYTSDED